MAAAVILLLLAGAEALADLAGAVILLLLAGAEALADLAAVVGGGLPCRFIADGGGRDVMTKCERGDDEPIFDGCRGAPLL